MASGCNGFAFPLAQYFHFGGLFSLKGEGKNPAGSLGGGEKHLGRNSQPRRSSLVVGAPLEIPKLNHRKPLLTCSSVSTDPFLSGKLD